MALNRNSPYSTEKTLRYCQGDILREVKLIEWAEIVDAEVEVTERFLPYCVILSQECDLEHDYNNRLDTVKAERDTDKFLQSILVCPAFPAEQLRLGIHLNDVGLKMQKFNSEAWRRIKQYNDYRYHFLPEHADSQVPDLVMDFKQYITIPRQIAYRDQFRSAVLASLDDLFREHLSSRFAHYLSRIGLPELESA